MVSKNQQLKAVTTDMQLEQGVYPIGSVVTLVTATFGYRGTLRAVTPDHYHLTDYVKIIDYGQIDAYSRGENTNADNGERKCEGSVLIERSANVAIEFSQAWQK